MGTAGAKALGLMGTCRHFPLLRFIHSIYARGSVVQSLLGAEVAMVNETQAILAIPQPCLLLIP